jgi:hypothetical protein
MNKGNSILSEGVMRVIEYILNEMPEDAPDRDIESAASDLESMNYEPMFLVSTQGFFRMKKADLGLEINRVLKLPSAEASDEVKSKQVELLAYYYALLCRLRMNDPAAWDTVNELYEDD